MEILRLQTGKRTESDTDRKNAQKVTSTITIVEFPVIADYGTNSEKQDAPNDLPHFENYP